MRYIQILDGLMCSSDIDSCCGDYGIATYIYVIKQAMEIIQFAVPILLIIMAGIQLFKMVTSPDDPQGKKMKSLLNKFIAAVIVFFIPFIVDLAMQILPNSFSIPGCWESATDIYTRMSELEDQGYDPFDDNRKKIGDQYGKVSGKNAYKDEGEGNTNNSSTNQTETEANDNIPTGTDNAPKKIKEKRKKVVKYAKKFKGNPYVLGGCSLTKGIDCSCFTKQVYAKYGYSLKRTAAEQAEDSTYQDVEFSNIQAGDLIFYSNGSKINHVALYIGNGQVIHASNPKVGIIITSYDYRHPSKAKRIIKYKG